MKKIILISNDKLYFNQTKVFSEFNDTINIIEGLSKKISYISYLEIMKLRDFSSRFKK